MQSAINNHLKERMKLLSSKIDWCNLCSNPAITWSIVKDNLEQSWNWNGLSMNPNITLDIIKHNPDKPWSWPSLSMNPNMTLGFNCFSKTLYKILFLFKTFKYKKYLKVTAIIIHKTL